MLAAQFYAATLSVLIHQHRWRSRAPRRRRAPRGTSLSEDAARALYRLAVHGVRLTETTRERGAAAARDLQQQGLGPDQ